MVYFETNMGMITSRWPGIAETIRRGLTDDLLTWRTGTPEKTLMFSGVHLTSAYNRQDEAALQATLVPEGSSDATVYGVALGDLQRVLLRRDALARLRVVVMNPVVAASCFSAVSQTDWLGDNRVSLCLGSGEADISMPFAVAPAMLRLASDDCLVLRDRLAQALYSPFQTHHFRKLDEILNDRLEQNLSFLKQDGDVSSLFGSAAGKQVVVVAAGPTADSQFDWIRSERGKLSVLAVSTALHPLLSVGIIPDAVLVIDPKDEILDHFKNLDTTALLRVPLVYLPTVHSDVLAAWPGPRLVTYIKRERFEQISESHPRGFLHCEGTVTHAAVDLAVQMGTSSIVLVGADFSYPEQASHVAGAVHRKQIDSASMGAAPEVVNGYGSRNTSRPDMVGFLRELEKYITLHNDVTFYNTGRAGAEIAGTIWMEGSP